MDFISADRSRDQEHTAELKNYNFGVVQHNADITRDIKNDRDTEKKQKQDIESGETFTQIKDAGGEAGAIGQAVATFKKIKKAQEEGKTALNSLKETISTAGEKAQNLVGKAKSAVPSVEAGKDVASGVYETAPKSAVKIRTSADAIAEKAPKIRTSADAIAEKEASSAGKELEAGAEGIGSKGLKTLGGIGAVAGMGMAIASDANGGWAKKSTADKIGNVAEIGGAGLDILGLGLEATGVGAPLGLALQAFGTLSQVASGIEESISAQQSVKPAEDEATKEEKEAEDSDKAQIEQTEKSVSGAGAGSLGVARQQQN